MFGWLSDEIALASRSNRSVNAPLIVYSATSRLSLVSFAR